MTLVSSRRVADILQLAKGTSNLVKQIVYLNLTNVIKNQQQQANNIKPTEKDEGPIDLYELNKSNVKTEVKSKADTSDIYTPFDFESTKTLKLTPINEPTKITSSQVEFPSIDTSPISSQPIKEVKQEVEKEEVTQTIDEFEDKKRPQLTESAVPTTQIGRMYHYGTLFGGIGLGVVSEAMKRGLGISKAAEGESLILSEANVNRIAEKLSKMRGAAQKLGQVLSIQDSNVLPPHVEKVLFKVQNAGSCMPQYQLRKVLEKSWGDDWMNKFQSFEFEPIAAASIGQVHRGVLVDGTRVAVKVQYPGVAKSIDSDLKSLSLILTASSILPKGLYLEKSIQAARKELGWETDYLREAHYIKAFNRELVSNSDYYTPKLIEELSSDMVLTMEWIPGMPLSEAIHLDQAAKDRIGDLVFKLCLMELFQFKFMQTDPNWTNFLYDPSSKKLGILDFGASRDFDDEFLSNYLKVLICAAKGDREGCLKYSYDLGYLTGDETLAMKEAHVDSIVILAEPFQKPGLYNFTGQTITTRVKDKIPLMIQSRLTPPPEQTYSLHRKLSGVFLLCARMNAKVDCHKLFWDAVKEAKVNIKE